MNEACCLEHMMNSTSMLFLFNNFTFCTFALGIWHLSHLRVAFGQPNVGFPSLRKLNLSASQFLTHFHF